MKQRLIQSFNPWVVVFVGMALFHTWRGSVADIIIFGVGAVLILSQVFGMYSLGLSTQPTFPTWSISMVVVVSALLLYVSPRHGLVNFLVLIAFVPIGYLLVMYRDRVHRVPSPQDLRGRLVWAIWAIVFALIELVAYLGSKMVGDLSVYPTISVLLDPVLDTPLGRATFVALWLMSGVYLFGVRRKR